MTLKQCPKCGRKQISKNFSRQTIFPVSMWYFECNHCSYRSKSAPSLIIAKMLWNLRAKKTTAKLAPCPACKSMAASENGTIYGGRLCYWYKCPDCLFEPRSSATISGAIRKWNRLSKAS